MRHAVLSLMLGAAAVAGGCRGERGAGAEAAASGGAEDAGAAAYALACARCHGPGGAGDGPLAARLGYVPDLRRPLAPEQVTAVVTHGRGAMPGHADRLSPEQIAAVVAHVGRLGGR